MQLKEYITGLQHLGLPVKDIEPTVEFYRSLGFEEVHSTVNGGDRVVFMQVKGLVVEIYEHKQAEGAPGAIEHLALDVTDIEKALGIVKALGYEVLESGIQFLPFWEHGIRYFTIAGLNGEKIEFSQIL